MPSWTLPVRAVQLVLAIIVLGISASIVSDASGSLDSANFMLFTSLWTLLVGILLTLIGMGTLGESGLMNMVALGLEFITWVFWLSGFGALASFLNKYDDLIRHADSGKIKADVAFGVIEWVLFCVTLGFVAYSAFSGGSGLRRGPTAPGGVA